MKIRLTENDLHRIIKESVKKVLMEDYLINNNGYSREGENRMQNSLKQVAINALERHGYKIWDNNNNTYMRVSVKDDSDGKKIERILTIALRPKEDRFGSPLKVSVEYLPSGYLAAEIYLPWFTQCGISL